MKSRISVVIFFCVVFATAQSSPVENNAKEIENLDTSGSISAETGNDDGDDLLRAKKSSITTFCVEIKPGNDQPTVVVCDPTKNNQQPIPPSPPPTPQLPPIPNPDYPHQIPILIPEPQPQYEPIPYEQLIVIPQQPQILQPQIPPYFPQQPQIILLRDSNCPSNKPPIVASPMQYGAAPANLYAPQQLSRATEYDPNEEIMQRTISGFGVNGISTSAFNSPLQDLIYSKRGPSLNQPQPQDVPSTGVNLLNGNQNPGLQQPRPYVIQCNPTITPLPQQSYRSNGAALLQTGQAPFLQQPGRIGNPAPSQWDSGSAQIQRAVPNNNGYLYNNQQELYSHPHSAHHQSTSGYSHYGKSADEMQRGIKNPQATMNSQQQRQMDQGAMNSFKIQNPQGSISVQQQRPHDGGSSSSLKIQHPQGSMNMQQQRPMEGGLPNNFNIQNPQGSMSVQQQRQMDGGSSNGLKIQNSQGSMNLQQQRQMDGGQPSQLKNQDGGSGTMGGGGLRGMSNNQEQHNKPGSARLAESSKNTGHILNAANSYGQEPKSSNSNNNNKNSNSNKGQGFSAPILGSSQAQYRQQIPNMEQSQFQQPQRGDSSYAQRLMQQMRSSLVQGNPDHPFANVQQSNMPDGKQINSKN